LLNVVDRLRVTTVSAFAVARLVRDKNHGDKLAERFEKLGVCVETNGCEIDFKSPYGRMMWDVLVMQAAQERLGIVERNRLGKIASSRRNKWPHGSGTVPLGYCLKHGVLFPIDAERDRVQRILEMMADPDMSMRQFVDQLGMISVSRPRVRERYGNEATVAAVRHPKDIYQSFSNMLPLYETGVYEMPLPNPTLHATVFGGLPVHREAPDDDGFVVLRYEAGRPPGGWAPPEVFEAIRVKQQMNRAFVNGNRERRPFSGRGPYEVDGVVYLVDCVSNKYRLSRLEGEGIVQSGRPSSVLHLERAITGRETLGAIEPAELHRVVVEGIVEALSGPQGVSGTVAIDSLHVETDAATRFALTTAHHRRRADRAREQSLRAEDPMTAAAYRRDVEREEAIILELSEIARKGSVGLPDTMDSVQIDVGFFVTLLSKIARTEQKVPGEILTACQRLIPDLHLYGIGEPDTLGWTATVRLPTLQGDALELQSITGRVSCSGTNRTLVDLVTPVTDDLTRYARGESLVELSAARRVKPGWAWAVIREHLKAEGFPASALSRIAGTPIPELRVLFGKIALAKGGAQVLKLIGDPRGLAEWLSSNGLIPAGADPEWAAGTLVAYCQPLSPRPHWTADNSLGQRAIDAVMAQGGSCTVEDLLKEIGTTSCSSATALAHVFGRYSGGQAAVLETAEDLQAGTSMKLRRGVVVRPCACPHCGEPLTFVLRVTEIPRQLLCEACWRTPTAEYQYPESYFGIERGLKREPSLSKLDASPSSEGRSKRVPSRSLTDVETSAVIADYRNKTVPILGEAGILVKHRINSKQLYDVVEHNGLEPRQPYRTRKRG
jgi:DNA invertase Pin-like site-specific DNA recombinase